MQRGRTRALNDFGDTADIQATRRVLQHDMQQLAQLGQGAYLYLLDEQYIDLQDHVHHLQERLGEVVWLQEEWVIAMMEIVFEIIQRIDTLADTVRDVDMIVQDILERERR